jgi:RNA polymerase sigma factor (sigma-70 family)
VKRLHLEHEALALKIARSMLRRLPASVLPEDIEQAARVGLWKALQRLQTDGGEYSPEQTRAYLVRRIKGSVLDELRRQDWASRRHRGKGERGPTVVRFDDLSPMEGVPFLERLAGSGMPPETAARIARDFARALEAPLTPLDREVVERVLLRGEQQSEAATALGTSAARVNQRIRRALNVMRAWLEGVVELGEGVPTRIPRDAHLRILEEHENRNRRRLDRAVGSHPRGARARHVERPLRADRMGGPPVAAAHRPVPARAGKPELARDALPRVRSPRTFGGGALTPQQKEALVAGFQRVAVRVRSDIARLRAQGYDALQIAAELDLPRDTVEQVLREPAPLRKCGPK